MCSGYGAQALAVPSERELQQSSAQLPENAADGACATEMVGMRKETPLMLAAAAGHEQAMKPHEAVDASWFHVSLVKVARMLLVSGANTAAEAECKREGHAGCRSAENQAAMRDG